jgi:2-keto-3-deoxy-L-rhamnonate aldolase RhmA
VVAARSRRDRVEGHAYAIPSAEDRIIVEVLNGTSRAGLARTATRLLRQRGLDVVFFGSADSASRTDSTRIIVRRGQRGAAEIVGQALGTGRIEIELDTLRRVDVSVILGADYQPSAGVHP